MRTPTDDLVRRTLRPLGAVLTLAILGLPLCAGAGGDGDDEGGDGVAAPRMLFVWDASIAADKHATKDLVQFARDHGIDTLVIEASPLGMDLPGAHHDYRKFVKRAHKKDLEVLAMSGWCWFAVAPDAGLPGQPSSHLEGWAIYETIAASGIQFDGVLDASLPYLTDFLDQGTVHNYFWEYLPYSAQDYLDYLRGIDLRIGDLPFHHTIPFWFDHDPRLSLALDGESELHPLNWYVSGIVDVSTVLAYRDRALGPGGILHLSLGEVLTGPCTIAVETSDLGPAEDYLTFWEEGPDFLEGELLEVSLALQGVPSFRGLAIHYYGSYRPLVE